MDEPQGYLDCPNDMGGMTPLKVETRTIIAPEHLARNIAENIKLDVPRFAYRPGLGIARAGRPPLAIVAAGPTLNDTIDRVRGFEHILVCGSAHDHLVRAGIVPTYALVCDGGVEDKGNLSLPQKETTYIIASQCDPSLFEHLKDHKVEMWHYRGQSTPDLDAERELLRGEPSLSWGSSVTVVGIQLCLLLGHQDFHFFGFDSCYGGYGTEQHCTKIHGSMPYQKVPATIVGRTFISDLALLEQANQFWRIVEAQGEFFHSTFYGDGLIAWMAKHAEPGLETYVTVVSDELEQAA